MAEFARTSCVSLLGPDNVQDIQRPSMGGEDFAFYSRSVPAAFIRLGCAGAATGNLPLHNSGFDIDENVLTLGAKVMAKMALDYFEQH
jgi:amidohydrolase